jgi:hypothetical protein
MVLEGEKFGMKKRKIFILSNTLNFNKILILSIYFYLFIYLLIYLY